MDITLQLPKSILVVLNQLYELEQKLLQQDDPAKLLRNVGKIKDAFAEEGLWTWDGAGAQLRIALAYENPLGQTFKETRTDLDATISGTGTENLVVVEVIKPIIRATVKDCAPEFSKIVQRGVVIVQSRKGQYNHGNND